MDKTIDFSLYRLILKEKYMDIHFHGFPDKAVSMKAKDIVVLISLLKEYYLKEDGYEEFKLKVIECPKCKRKMIDAEGLNLGRVFPAYYKEDLETQILRKKMVIRSETKEDDNYLCEQCRDNMEFTCFSCKEKRPKKDIKHRYGDPLDYICIQCYKTLTAEEWDNQLDLLNEEHRWDFS